MSYSTNDEMTDRQDYSSKILNYSQSYFLQLLGLFIVKIKENFFKNSSDFGLIDNLKVLISKIPRLNITNINDVSSKEFTAQHSKRKANPQTMKEQRIDPECYLKIISIILQCKCKDNSSVVRPLMDHVSYINHADENGSINGTIENNEELTNIVLELFIWICSLSDICESSKLNFYKADRLKIPIIELIKWLYHWTLHMPALRLSILQSENIIKRLLSLYVTCMLLDI